MEDVRKHHCETGTVWPRQGPRGRLRRGSIPPHQTSCSTDAHPRWGMGTQGPTPSQPSQATAPLLHTCVLTSAPLEFPPGSFKSSLLPKGLKSHSWNKSFLISPIISPLAHLPISCYHLVGFVSLFLGLWRAVWTLQPDGHHWCAVDAQ